MWHTVPDIGKLIADDIGKLRIVTRMSCLATCTIILSRDS